MCDKKSTLFYGAERSGVRFGGRPQGGPHRRQAEHPIARRRGGVATFRPWNSRDDCAGATELDHVRCRGSARAMEWWWVASCAV